MRVFRCTVIATASEGDVPDVLCVVIPAYNEALNVGPCLTSVRNTPAATGVCCWSTMHPLITRLNRLLTVSALDVNVSRFDLLQAGPRPNGERWVGKNWARTRAMQQVQAEWVLFLDADVH